MQEVPKTLFDQTSTGINFSIGAPSDSMLPMELTMKAMQETFNKSESSSLQYSNF